MDVEVRARMGRAFREVRSALYRAEPTSGAASDLPRSSRHTLLVIHDRPGVSPGTLAGLLGVTPAAVSPLMRKLTDDGLITRTPHPDDARSVTLSLAPGGAEIVDELLGHIAEVVAEIFDPLGDGEQEQLVKLLERGLSIDPGT